jgi:subfamily B ATP-binding cassette protein HlyB/CyaB
VPQLNEEEKTKNQGNTLPALEERNASSGAEGDSASGNSEDWGFRCLVVAARVLGVPADYNQLVRAYPPTKYPNLRLLRAAKGLNLKAKKTTGNTGRLERMPLPSIVFMKDGGVELLIKSSPEKLLVYDPTMAEEGVAARPSIVETEKFIERWSGEAILLARRFSFAAMG